MRELVTDHTTAGPIEGLYVDNDQVIVLYQGNKALWCKASTDYDGDPCITIVAIQRRLGVMVPEELGLMAVSGLITKDELEAELSRRTDELKNRQEKEKARREEAERNELRRLLNKYGTP